MPSQPVCSTLIWCFTQSLLQFITPAGWEKLALEKKSLGHLSTQSADTLSFPETALIFPGCVPRQSGIWKATCITPCPTCQNKSHELSHTGFLDFSASSRKDGLTVKQHFSDEPSGFGRAESEKTLRTEAIFIHPPAMGQTGRSPLCHGQWGN